MVGANLSWCILERADLSHAVMESAQLVGVKMLCANLEGANLRGCNFEDPGGSRTNMEGKLLLHSVCLFRSIYRNAYLRCILCSKVQYVIFASLVNKFFE